MSISTKGIQDHTSRERRSFGVHPSVALGILLSIAAFALGDLMEVIPIFAPLVASSFFPFFHEIHDLLAVVVALYAAYKYQARLGVAAILLYLTAHIPYVIVQFPGDAPEILRIIVGGFVAILGIWLINQLHKTGTLVRQTQEHLQLQVERMPIGLIVWDTNFRVQSWNPAAESIFGFSCEEALEKHPYDLIVPKGAQPQVDDVWQRLLEGDMTAHSINDNTTKDGRTILCDWLNTPLRGDDGQVLGVLSMVQDITERKQAEERIARLTAVLRSIRNVNQLITREKDRQSLIRKSCDLLVQRQGYERAWILLLDENRNFVTAASTGLGEKAPAFLKQLETGNYPVCVRELLAQEQAFIAYDQPGKQHQGCVLADEHSSRGVFRCKLEYGGKLYGVLGVALSSGVASDKEEQGLFLELCGDIAFALANIEGEEKLRASEIRYQTAIQTSIDGFLVVDTQGRFVDVNNAYCQLTGYSREELLAMSTQDIEVVETPEETAQHIQRILEKGGDRFETRHKCRDGRIVDLDVGVNYLSTEGLFFVFLRDITERKKAEKEIRRQNEFLNNVFESITHPLYVVDANDYTVKMANSASGIRNISEGQTCYALTHEKNEPCHDEGEHCPLEGIKGTRKPVVAEHTHYNAEGNPRLVEMHGYPVFDTEGNLVEMIEYCLDITERRRVEEEIARFKTVSDLATYGITMLDTDLRITYANKICAELHGYTREELIGKHCTILIPENQIEVVERLFEKSEKAGGFTNEEVMHKRKDGTTFPALMTGVTVRDDSGKPVYTSVVFLDVTGIKQAEEVLRASLHEKEVLLKEIYHRVKNNLQIIISLLNTQSRYIKDKRDLELFRESQDRIRAMALVHERLYQSGDLGKIDFGEYVKSQANELSMFYGIDRARIQMKIDIRDIYLGITEAVPLGLLVNELISNSLKHAFPGDRAGDINISLRQDEEGRRILTVSDNGVGLPEAVNWQNPETMGLQLMQGLAKQLDADVVVDRRGQGTRFIITLPGAEEA